MTPWRLVIVALLAAARFGAATALHVGQRIAVVIDGRVRTVATVNSPLGPLVELLSGSQGASREEERTLATRVSQAIETLRGFIAIDYGDVRR